MKSFRQFIIEKSSDPKDPRTRVSGEKFPNEKEASKSVLRNKGKKGTLANQSGSNKSSSPDIRARDQAMKDIKNTGGTDPRWDNENEFKGKKGGKVKQSISGSPQAKDYKPEAGSQKLGNTTKGGEVRTNKPKTIQGRKDYLERTFGSGNRSDKYKTNKPPTGKQVQQFAKDITGKAADDKSGVGGKPGVGQTKSVKGQTLTGGKFKGATPIDKRSATKLRKFAKDSSATENPFSGKSDKRTLKTSARRTVEKWETAKKAANKYGSRVRTKGAELLKSLQKTNKDQAAKSTRIQRNIDTDLKGRMSSASKNLNTNKASSAYKNELQSKGDKVIEKIRKQNRTGSPKSTPIKNTSNPSNINIDSRYKSSIKNTSFGVDTSQPSKFNVGNKVVEPPKTSKVTTSTGGQKWQGPNPAPKQKITFKNFLNKTNRGSAFSRIKSGTRGVTGKLGAVGAAVDAGFTWKGERAKGRSALGATLATAAKVGSSVVGGVAGAFAGGGVASAVTGFAGSIAARTATNQFIDKVFKPKNAPTKTGPGKGGSGTIPGGTPKKRKPIKLNVGLNRSGKIDSGSKQKLVKP